MCVIACFMKMYSYIIENRELRRKNKEYSVVYSEFLYFVCAPAAIFQRKYPRSKKVDIQFVLVKILFSSLGFLGVYVLTTDWLIPIINEAPSQHFGTLLLQLIEVSLYFNLSVFYMIFENIL